MPNNYSYGHITLQTAATNSWRQNILPNNQLIHHLCRNSTAIHDDPGKYPPICVDDSTNKIIVRGAVYATALSATAKRLLPDLENFQESEKKGTGVSEFPLLADSEPAVQAAITRSINKHHFFNEFRDEFHKQLYYAILMQAISYRLTLSSTDAAKVPENMSARANVFSEALAETYSTKASSASTSATDKRRDFEQHLQASILANPEEYPDVYRQIRHSNREWPTHQLYFALQFHTATNIDPFSDRPRYYRCGFLDTLKIDESHERQVQRETAMFLYFHRWLLKTKKEKLKRLMLAEEHEHIEYGSWKKICSKSPERTCDLELGRIPHTDDLALRVTAKLVVINGTGELRIYDRLKDDMQSQYPEITDSNELLFLYKMFINYILKSKEPLSSAQTRQRQEQLADEGVIARMQLMTG